MECAVVTGVCGVCGGYRSVECARVTRVWSVRGLQGCVECSGVTGVWSVRGLQGCIGLGYSGCLQGIEIAGVTGVWVTGVCSMGTTLLQRGGGCGGYREVQCVHGVKEGCGERGLQRRTVCAWG